MDGLPVMGRIPGVEGAFISCGHNCWGILWAPASALAISELIVDGHCECMDLSMFSPSRFIPTELDSSSEESSSNSGISSSRIMAMRNTRTISGSNSKSSSSGSSRSNDSRTSSSSDAEGSGADSTNDSRFSDNKDSRLSRSSGRGSRSGNSGSNSRREKLPFEREGFEPYEDCNYNQDDEDSTYDEYGDFCGVDSYDDIAS